MPVALATYFVGKGQIHLESWPFPRALSSLWLRGWRPKAAGRPAQRTQLRRHLVQACSRAAFALNALCLAACPSLRCR
eukprot:5149483-Prymnesium_polylepis.1